MSNWKEKGKSTKNFRIKIKARFSMLLIKGGSGNMVEVPQPADGVNGSGLKIRLYGRRLRAWNG